MSAALNPAIDLRLAASEFTTGDVHLWMVRLDPPDADVSALRQLLDDDEKARSDRFRFDVHRRRFTVGRGFQRLVLGTYLGIEPAMIRYVYGPKGKPALVDSTPGGSLFFNLSNSEEIALLGLVREREVGVDIEKICNHTDLEALASRFFSAGENRKLLALPDDLRIGAFFRCWTRKEAYLKAVGDGLAAPLDSFDVSLAPDEPARMLALEGSRERAKAWRLFHLEPADGYLGAVAIEGGEWRLSLWNFLHEPTMRQPA